MWNVNREKKKFNNRLETDINLTNVECKYSMARRVYHTSIILI